MSTALITAPVKLEIVQLKIATSQLVRPNQVIISARDFSNNTVLPIKSDKFGTVIEILTKVNDVIEKSSPLVKIKLGCTHPVIFSGLCADCGQAIKENDERDPEIEEIGSQPSKVLIPNLPTLKVKDSIAQDLANKDKLRLQNMRKLVLLCDLDHTLIHTTSTSENLVDDFNTETMKKFKFKETKTWHVTKFRPGLDKFLEEMSGLYEMQIATLGIRPYAEKISRLIDPEQKYFNDSKMLSRCDILDSNGKIKGNNAFHKANNLKHLFPCGIDMVVIIDDRTDVWKMKGNVIHVPKYNYWKDVGDINDPNAKARGDKIGPFKDKIPEKDNDDYLSILGKILKDIHSKYYWSFDRQIEKKKSGNRIILPDTHGAMKYFRSKILENYTFALYDNIQGPYQLNTSDWRHEGWWSKQDIIVLIKDVIHILGGRVFDETSDDFKTITHLLVPWRCNVEFPLTKITSKNRSKSTTPVNEIIAVSERWIWTSYWTMARTDINKFTLHPDKEKELVGRLKEEFGKEKKVAADEDTKNLLGMLSQSVMDEMDAEVEEILSSSHENSASSSDEDSPDPSAWGLTDPGDQPKPKKQKMLEIDLTISSESSSSSSSSSSSGDDDDIDQFAKNLDKNFL